MSPRTGNGSAGSRGAGSENPLLRFLDALGRQERLDVLSGPVRQAVQALPLGRARDVLHGLPIGHPLHPALVQAPLGAWLSAAVLDCLPGNRRGARVLIGMGLLTAAPAALAGWVDWAEQHPQQKRTGLVHAASVSTAVALYARSWTHRGPHGHPVRARALGFAGLGAVGFGALLGGHLAYRQAAGSDKAGALAFELDDGWHAVGRTESFPAGTAVRRQLGEAAVLVFREDDGRIHVLADRCSHLAGPLSEGRIVDGCVECPWHGSVFRLSDGANVRGPATAPQPVFDTRVTDDGMVQVRLPGAVRSSD
ncbi:Rieske 2Fe-2S domain-containing protein [Streptomyces sp. NPDC059913]|uniref:Rieske 2Fe-2S domain-containing protein n=1 Tax=unclassified Streptomyces TaxID=2593676 RepID=UPI00364DD63C